MEPILTKYIREPNSYTLDFSVKHGAYEGLKKALGMTAGRRHRAGEGVGPARPRRRRLPDRPEVAVRPQGHAAAEVHRCNADESEPGTFKDHVLMERNPHSLFEGCLIGCWAIGAKVAYIYIRGEFYHVQKLMEAELAKAYAAGYVGKNIMGSGFDCDIVIHRGAGAYEAGEETALIESLEGKRAQPRIKPPFPAVSGLYNCPTAVNNVETLCNLPPIVLNGAEWFASLGPEKNGGPKLFCVSGHVKKPGVFEASMKTTLRELIYDHAGGIRDGHKLKAVIPGGSSVPILLDARARHPGVASTTCRRRDRCWARPASSSWTRRPAWCGRRATFSTSTSTSRAASARRAAKAATGSGRS